jgi:hypothetical protein
MKIKLASRREIHAIELEKNRKIKKEHPGRTHKAYSSIA